MSDVDRYLGKASLEVMEEAENDQRFLLNSVLRPATSGLSIVDFEACP